MLCKAFQYYTTSFFCSLDLLLLFPFLISAREDLNFSWSFFTSAKFISPFFTLLTILRALSNLSNFSSVVLPLYLYIKSSVLTFFYLNQLFFQTFICKFIKYFVLVWDWWSIFIIISIFFNCFNLSLILNCLYLFLSLIFNCFNLFFKSFPKGE